MAQSQNTELQVFAGGLHLRPEAHLITPMEARILVNVNIRSLSLKPYRTPLFIEYVNDPYMYYFNNQFHFFPLWRSSVTWNRAWYWSSNAGTGKVLKDGTELPIGIPAPKTSLTVSPAVAGDAEGISGNIAYVYTYYHRDTGAESPPSPPSRTLDLDKEAALLTGFLNVVDYEIRIYRIGGIITAYTAVETVSGQITTFTDELKFSEIEATILDTLRAYPPPTGLQLLEEHQGRFYGQVASKLYYTAAGKPDSWYALDYISFEETITMIASVSNGLLVATSTQTWIIVGSNPINFAKYLISESEGCTSALSVAKLDGTAIWLSGNGFITSNGAGIQNISIGKLGSIRGIDPRGSVVYDGMYLMTFGGSLTPGNSLVPGPDGGPDDDPDVGGLVPGATSGDSNLPEGAVVIDFTFGNPVFSTIEESGLGDVGFYNNKLYQITNPETETMNIATEDGGAQIVTEQGIFNIVANVSGQQSLREMFADIDLTRIKYISPLLTDGSIGMLKQYEKVRITFLGAITVSIFNDNKVLMQTQLLTSIKRDSQWLGIPVGNNRGYGIQIQIKGVGIIDSIMYTWTPWETQ